MQRKLRSGAAATARVVYGYQFPHVGREDTTPTEFFDYSPEKLASLRTTVRRFTEESEARLAQEMTLVYKLNGERTLATPVGYMTKGKAADIARVAGGMLLDLDPLYGGILVASDHLFISDEKLEYGLRKCGSNPTPTTLVNCLINDRQAA